MQEVKTILGTPDKENASRIGGNFLDASSPLVQAMINRFYFYHYKCIEGGRLQMMFQDGKLNKFEWDEEGL